MRVIDWPGEVALAPDGHLGEDTRRIVPLLADHSAHDHVSGVRGICPFSVNLDKVLAPTNFLGQFICERTFPGL